MVKTIECFCLSLIRTSHTLTHSIDPQTLTPKYTYKTDDVHKFMATIKFHWLYIYNTSIGWRSIASGMCVRMHYTKLISCTADTVSYLFHDWNVKCDVYSLKWAIRVAHIFGYIIDYDSIFFLSSCLLSFHCSWLGWATQNFITLCNK